MAAWMAWTLLPRQRLSLCDFRRAEARHSVLSYEGSMGGCTHLRKIIGLTARISWSSGPQRDSNPHGTTGSPKVPAGCPAASLRFRHAGLMPSGCSGAIRTRDLQVMSLTSYRAALRC